MGEIFLLMVKYRTVMGYLSIIQHPYLVRKAVNKISVMHYCQYCPLEAR